MRLHPSTSLLVSLACLTVATLVVLAQVPALAGALFTSSPGEDPTIERLQRYLAAGERDLATYRARFDGRSAFYKPKPPPAPAPPRPPVVARTEPVDPEPLPPPRRTQYAGPSVVYVFGDTVGFHGDLRLRVGEESNGVRVIATNPPWSVTLAWSGGEYEVDVFKRFSEGFQNETRTASTPRIPGGGFVSSRGEGG